LQDTLLHLLLNNYDLLNIGISQGSVATRLGCGGVFKYDFVTDFLLTLTVKIIENRLTFGTECAKNCILPIQLVDATIQNEMIFVSMYCVCVPFMLLIHWIFVHFVQQYDCLCMICECCSGSVVTLY